MLVYHKGTLMQNRATHHFENQYFLDCKKHMVDVIFLFECSSHSPEKLELIKQFMIDIAQKFDLKENARISVYDQWNLNVSIDYFLMLLTINKLFRKSNINMVTVDGGWFCSTGVNSFF